MPAEVEVGVGVGVGVGVVELLPQPIMAVEAAEPAVAWKACSQLARASWEKAAARCSERNLRNRAAKQGG